jgi:hypothetical protein
VALKTTRFKNFSKRRAYADESAVKFYQALDAYENETADDDERAKARLQRMRASKERALLIQSLKKRGLGADGFVRASKVKR